MFERIAAHRTPLLALAVVIAMLAVALAIRFSSGTLPTLPIAASEASAQNVPEEDSDGDGAPDWQESLLGTDPFDASSTPSEQSITAIASSTSVTEQFARAFLYQYLASSNGAKQPVANPGALGVSVANSIRTPLPEFTPYTADNLVLGGSSATAQRRYYTDLEGALAPLKKITEPELLIYSRVVGEEEGARWELEAIIGHYRLAAAAMMRVTLPTNAASVHLSAANSLLYYSSMLEQLLHYTDDPIGSLALLSAYNEAEQSLFTAFDNLRGYFALYSIQP